MCVQCVSQLSSVCITCVSQLYQVDAQVVHHCPVFKQMMEETEVLRSYAVRLKELGYDRIDTLKYINADDMASINMLVGHRRLLLNTIQKLSGHPSTSHASS